MTTISPKPEPIGDSDEIIRMEGPPPIVVKGRKPQDTDADVVYLLRKKKGREVRVRPPDHREGVTDTDEVGANVTDIRTRVERANTSIDIPQDWGEVTIKSDLPDLKKRLDPNLETFQKFQREIGGLVFIIQESNEIIIQRDSLAYRKADSDKQEQMRARLQKFINHLQTEKFRDNKITIKVRKMHEHGEDFDAAVGF